jgi:hypothetical protein
MIDTTLLDGIIGGLERTRRRLRRVAPRSSQPRKLAEIVKETEGLLAKLQALRADGAGREPEANGCPPSRGTQRGRPGASPSGPAWRSRPAR